ncbi:hypothetical protein VTJ04DRAFT_7669 [Mycothermus thermophilus]|uniref:uncharacterized protein n=1 Tax=Humicola insolens TaxID=85995 RepID=UPI003743F3CE
MPVVPNDRSSVTQCRHCKKNPKAPGRQHCLLCLQCPVTERDGGGRCTNIAKLDEPGACCRERHACSVSNCGCRRWLTGHCKAHQCLHSGCTRATSTNEWHCEEHRCRAPYCFRGARQGGVCPDHAKTCRAGCGSPAEAGGKYCKDHTCVFRGCEKQAAHTISEGRRVCPDHKCVEPGCGSLAKLANLCDKHRCKHDHCPNKRLRPNQGCPKHVCQAKGCPSLSERESSFCAKHKCEISGCRRPAGQGAKYCDVHSHSSLSGWIGKPISVRK